MNKLYIGLFLMSIFLCCSCKEAKVEKTKSGNTLAQSQEFNKIRKIIEQKNENIDYLRLSYEEVQKFNCIYSKKEDDYWNKNFHLAISFNNEIALVKLKSESKKIEIPLILSKNLTEVQEFEEEHIFKNDSIEIQVKLTPTKSNIISTEKYFSNIRINDRGNISTYKMIGFCRK